MREINLPWIFGIVEPMPASKLQEYSQEIQIAQINGQKVLAAAIAVEQEFEKIINARVAGSAGQ